MLHLKVKDIRQSERRAELRLVQAEIGDFLELLHDATKTSKEMLADPWRSYAVTFKRISIPFLEGCGKNSIA
jgi:hypothetical protein